MYKNLNRPGIRTTTTIDPRLVEQDIAYSIRTLSPHATPLFSLLDKLSKGRKPISKKIWIAQDHLFDDVDYVSKTLLGSDVDAKYSRFALLTVEQLSRPDLKSVMYYQPQDLIYIEATDQTVEVWANPSSSIRIGLGSNDFFTFDASLVGGASGSVISTTPSNTILVRNVEPYPIKPFDTSWIVYQGRTIFESQDIEAVPTQRDIIYDCNFVEHKEKLIQMTEDQKNIIKTKLKVPDWTFNQRRMIEEFKQEIERTLMFGKRSVDATVPDRPKYTMQGILESIKTNVAYYDKNITPGPEFERLIQNFIYEQAYRYNPGGKNKLWLVGSQALVKLNQSFADYRRTTTLDVSGKVGFNITRYDFIDFSAGIVHFPAFDRRTNMSHWILVIDPALIELRVVKDFSNRLIVPGDNNFIRYYTLMTEWQGTIAVEYEQAHALLRT